MKWWRNVTLIFSPLLSALGASFFLVRYTNTRSLIIVLIVMCALVLSLLNTIIVVLQISKR